MEELTTFDAGLYGFVLGIFATVIVVLILKAKTKLFESKSGGLSGGSRKK